MALTIDLSPEVEQRVHELAAELGMEPAVYLTRHIEQEFSTQAVTVRTLLALPPDQRSRILAAAAEDAAELYEADLARPAMERELTALTALDGEEFHDSI